MKKRVIKFRVWDGKKMHHAPLIHMITSEDFEGSCGLGVEFSAVEGALLIQFTGLLDADGKEIYEGDVLALFKEPFVKNAAHEEYFEVRWVMGSFGIATPEGWSLLGVLASTLTAPNDSRVCVLGNKFENLELLEEGTESSDEVGEEAHRLIRELTLGGELTLKLILMRASSPKVAERIKELMETPA